ncbi:DUF3828 domain-containing protein [Erwinia tasmaniensis]|uniref:DUF3828 domain-containing protein n=1 Tax=Erwinia tasmaniensis (strain DSM 17950 / CFBP 7177 / CIP 109463 / NCPPB 4357 / Et1/99) TaxID=465817 RepID=B2VKC1_ERWT9|nr:DUF3828 domain-containing protein [Erwinia tasmaniensis]CAO98128.1 Conserved hypothetical protein [Erwinia tasmaniensis Et1/99]
MKKWLLMLVTAIVAFGATAAEHNNDPQSTSLAFYNWYLTALSKEESPIDEHDPLLNEYVTQRLLQKINLLIKSPDGMDDDYFLQDQDYSDGWVNNVSVSRFTYNGKRAAGDVTLGRDPSDRQHLLVTLVHERDGWKIDEVQPESSER